MSKRIQLVLICLCTVCNVQGALLFTNLHSFTGSDGDTPSMSVGLVEGPDGFYGTTQWGSPPPYGTFYGTVFKITRDGIFTNLFFFEPTNEFQGKHGMFYSIYGGEPHGLVLGKDGNFYGVTFYGGARNSNQLTAGTIFRITTEGAFSSLASFNGTNGEEPSGVLVQTDDGVFYGTTFHGGPSYHGIQTGGGTVFKFETNGAITSLYSFDGTNGSGPTQLVLGKDGYLYGTTEFAMSNYGSVYRIDTNGNHTTLLLFNGTNGAQPTSSLVWGSDGNLFGTTTGFGPLDYTNTALGTVFKITTNGVLTTLAVFNGTNGGHPFAPLTAGSDGNFYGTSANGGDFGRGTVFRITPDGTLTTLHSFGSVIDSGVGPSGLLQGSDGNFYGTTSYGGSSGKGTVFRISVPMPPMFQPPIQSNNALQLTWSAIADQTYQLQFSSNLSSGNWNNLGGPTVATNGTMSASDTIGSESERFYRAVLLP